MNKQKKIMLLGGLRYLLPVIEAAHKQGYYVLTADYLPNNIAHKYSRCICNYCSGNSDFLFVKEKSHNNSPKSFRKKNTEIYCTRRLEQKCD